MQINALTVCVDYSDRFEPALVRWRPWLESLTVVTTPDDTETQRLARAAFPRVELVTTDLFTADGATFNKGRAMEFARRHHMDWSDWALWIDADIIPPNNWFERVVAAKPEPGFLYGAWRYQCDDMSRLDDPTMFRRFREDGVAVGYFQLFHTDDPAVDVTPPLLDTWWLHGGNYDNQFMDRWRTCGRDRRRLIPELWLAHQGPRNNWFGRDQHGLFENMQAERRRRDGQWDHERLPFVPVD